MAALGIDPAPLIEAVVRAFFLTTVRWGAFHGDVHAGNMRCCCATAGSESSTGGSSAASTPTPTGSFSGCSQGCWATSPRGPTSLRTSVDLRAAIQDAVGLSDEQLTAFVRSLIEPMLIRPFGEVSLAAVMQATQVQVAKA